MNENFLIIGDVNIKRILIIACFIAVLFMGISSVNADDLNNASDIDTSIVDADNDVKTFTDLANEIENTKKNSVLVLHGKYKYDPEKDSKYKKGIVISKNIKIKGKDNCIIDGAGKARCLKINSKCKVTLKGITFKNGYVDEAEGGAIYAGAKSNLKIKDCTFKYNEAHKSNGGAISIAKKATLKIYNSKFYHNKAIRASDNSWPKDKRGMGGAIKVQIGSKLTLKNSVFKYNEAFLSIILVLSHSDGVGTKTSTVYVKDCLFKKNTANYNGAFYLDEYGKGKFLNTKFKNNVAQSKGGALVLDASKYVLIKKCSFSRNSGIFGAAIDLFKYGKSVSHVNIESCTFTKNKAKVAGGAIFSDNGKLNIMKSKFNKNSAGTSGGAVEIRKGTLTLKFDKFIKNSAKCGGALLIKDKKSIYVYASIFSKNKATVNGKNLLCIIHHEVANITITPKQIDL